MGHNHSNDQKYTSVQPHSVLLDLKIFHCLMPKWYTPVHLKYVKPQWPNKKPQKSPQSFNLLSHCFVMQLLLLPDSQAPWLILDSLFVIIAWRKAKLTVPDKKLFLSMNVPISEKFIMRAFEEWILGCLMVCCSYCWTSAAYKQSQLKTNKLTNGFLTHFSSSSNASDIFNDSSNFLWWIHSRSPLVHKRIPLACIMSKQKHKAN